MIHELKILPEYYEPVRDGKKKFEIRKDDRGFLLGDSLRLNKWTPNGGYTGETIITDITYILRGGSDPGIEKGFCLMGLGPILETGRIDDPIRGEMNERWNGIAIDDWICRRIEERAGMYLRIVSTAQNGMPERLVILPHHHKALFVELKEFDRWSDPVRVGKQFQLEKLGYEVWKIKNMEEAVKFIERVNPYGTD